MKLPPFNFQFIQLCFVMTMLALLAISVIFGLRGSVPPWLLMVSGQGKPPPAQAQLVKVDSGMVVYAAEFPLTSKQDTFAKDYKRATDLPSLTELQSLLELKRSELAKSAISLPKPAKQTAAQKLWGTLLTLAGLLAFIAAGFHKSLPRPSLYLPKRLKALFTTAN